VVLQKSKVLTINSAVNKVKIALEIWVVGRFSHSARGITGNQVVEEQKPADKGY
jgi:hypothetical protein